MRTRLLLSLLTCGLVAGTLVLTAQERPAAALPPAGTDALPVVATVDVTSRLGNDRVVLTGWGLIERGAPHADGGDEVSDLEVTGLSLNGASQIGLVSVAERPNDGASYVSSGELRSPDGDFPASAALDLFIDVTVPASPIGQLLLHNEDPLRLLPEGGEVDAWPPLGATFRAATGFGIDDDGDGLIDEDTADDDGDGLIDEDRPGPDPDTPGTGSECGNNADCDAFEGEDPPAELCPPASPGVETLCDGDADGLIDEDPACVPLLNEGNTHLKAGLCITALSLEIAPQLPSYSVARGGPSGLHPADIFALTPGLIAEDPEPVAVSGNDDFAGAWDIPAVPFAGHQNTFAATLESDSTGFLSPKAHEPVANAGDGDGFEVTPENALFDDGLIASDIDSGTDASTACADPDPQGKDRHIFRDFNFDTASISVVSGIEVRLDASVDNGAGGPRMCVQLSGDGGGAWSTFARITPLLNSSEQTYILGGPRDSWRLLADWAASELTNENFRVRVTNVSTDGSRDFHLESIAANLIERVETQACSQIGSTVWFRFTPARDDVLVFDTNGSDFDTVLALHTGDDVFSTTSLACDDDSFGLGGASRITRAVDAGQTYSIQAGGFRGDSGNLVLNISGTTPQAPFPRIRCADLGLTADGCDAGGDGDQDDLDALSYGGDFSEGGAPELFFSVAPGSRGVAGSAVRVQADCPPSSPGIAPEPEPDEFGSPLDGTNVHVLDGNGPVGACAPAFPLALNESAMVRDDLNALDARESAAVDPDLDGVPDARVYFSLDAASPSLATLGRSPADVLRTSGGATPALYASAAALGLQPGDDVDGICLQESGNGVFGAGDLLLFSLAAGSPTLSEIQASPGDLLLPGSPPSVEVAASQLGLLASDDVNALKCRAALTEADGDVDCNGTTNAIDAVLVLQLTALLIRDLPCPERSDVNEDGRTNSVDAALILQFTARLIPELPV